ncbi:MAG: hypothetical protein HPY30_03620 [Gammaproteobacteria bacterium (ex Lamellibrachia satsuma)]|nr:MAG: hypothetical protein HPY30_03620 [Gammaproteobacteria bacterium (ex Lamellibrachia satsuma)]
MSLPNLTASFQERNTSEKTATRCLAGAETEAEDKTLNRLTLISLAAAASFCIHSTAMAEPTFDPGVMFYVNVPFGQSSSRNSGEERLGFRLDYDSRQLWNEKRVQWGASRFRMAPLLDFNMTGAGAGSIDLRGQTLAYSPGGEGGSSSTPAASKASMKKYPWVWIVLGTAAAGMAISCANDQWPCFHRDEVSGDSVPPDDYVSPPT